MKKLAVLMIMMCTVTAFAQAPKPIFEKEGKLIRATYFHDNGEIAQQGTYYKGELHGEWVSFDLEGKKTAIANYENGKKVGKWFFWNDEKLTEVDYTDNRIANVVEWKEGNAVVLRQQP